MEGAECDYCYISLPFRITYQNLKMQFTTSALQTDGTCETIDPVNREAKPKLVFVNLPGGKTLTVDLKSTCTISNLSAVILASTGIPQAHQNLYSQNKLVSTDEDLIALEDGSNLVLSIKLKGGANQCDICYENGDFHCEQCQQTFCRDCCLRFHKHPNRVTHTPKLITKPNDATSTSCSPEPEIVSNDSGIQEDNCDDYDIADSPNTSSAFMEASMIMTLAEKFNLTRFKGFQKEVITQTLSGKDSLVIQPTGVGKSLCFQFPPVHEDKKAVIVTPTISLMQDHVVNAEQKGIKATYLGSAQLDFEAENRAFSEEGQENLIFVTPEWIANPQKLAKVQTLAQCGKLSFIAIDEAHLFHQWQQFRTAYKDLQNLKHRFPTTPIMCLTATAPPTVEESILQILRDPFITRASVNRGNIYLACEEIPASVKRKDFSYFASRVAEILPQSQSAIIYTDFIDDVGPIMSELSSCGISSVAYYGEMDIKSRAESYRKWREGEVHLMVATTAFGMGINKPDIRHIFRYGVPENACSWAQELGRARATLFYSQTNIEHAGAWIKGRLSDKSHCSRILNEFSQCWRYAMCDLVCKCRRTMLLELFGETQQPTEDCNNPKCCDVCELKANAAGTDTDLTEEFTILHNAISGIGNKGELKLAQWIRGSMLAWTNEYNKQELSYGNFKGHSEM